ncbi:CHASE domain-containing protein [Candidatus Gracilibacteria bacterium]|nr:CHASE domain-containing protein [Candidatus Gracilibacteria bacterium]
MSFYLSGTVGDFVDNKVNLDFENSVSSTISDLQTHIDLNKGILNSGAGLYASSDDVSRSEWNIFITSQEIIEKNPEIKALEYIERVKNKDKNAFTRGIIREGFKDFAIHPESQNDEYLVVNYIEPIEGNEAAFGFDLASNPDRLEALQLSRDKNDFITTAPIQLVQSEETAAAFLGIVPVYENGQNVDTLQARRTYLQGYILAVFQAEDLFAEIAEHSSSLGLHLSVKDSESNELLFDSSSYEKDHNFPKLGITSNMEVGSRLWVLEFHPNSIFLERFGNDLLMPKITLGMGMFLALIIIGFFSLINRSRLMAQKIANEMTLNFRNERDKVMGQKEAMAVALEQAEAAEKLAKDKSAETQRLNDLMVGREVKMIELKKQAQKNENPPA